jgi:hypothetical protein
MALNTESCYAGCHLCGMLFLLIVTNKPFILNVIMLSAIVLNVVALLNMMEWHST